MYRRTPEGLSVLLVHPGGPFWARKDRGAWSIPKGELEEGEDPLSAARREFMEETGCTAEGAVLPLQPVRQRSGKTVHAWALEGTCDPVIGGSRFTLEWPPRSGKQQQFAEVDRVEWFPVEVALQKVLPAQQSLILELVELLRRGN